MQVNYNSNEKLQCEINARIEETKVNHGKKLIIITDINQFSREMNG